MPQSEVNDYIEISDFTPGIHSGYNSRSDLSLTSAVTEPAADGAAQLVGTKGCIGYPTGGLGPLPREVDRYTMLIDDPTTIPNYYPSQRPYVAILDILNFPGVQPPSFLYPPTPPLIPPAHPKYTDYSGISDFFFMVVQRYYKPSGSGTFWRRQWTCGYQSLFLNAAMDAVDPLYGATHPVLDDFGWGGLYGDAIAQNTADYGFGCIDIGRSNDADENKPGNPHFRFGMGGRINTAEEDDGQDYRTIYDYSGILQNGYHEFVDHVSPAIVFSHQGRLVWTDASNVDTSVNSGANFYYGANWLVGANGAAYVYTTDELYWSKVNSTDIDNPDGTVFVEENPYSLGAWASMNANEMFLVKHIGGGVAVQGSLNNPTVTRLPGVEPTRGAVAHTVVTPMGCIYGSKSGVWVWNGSDTSQCLSPSLDGFFWQPDGTEMFHQCQLIGRFNYMHPYVLVPNNFIMDTRTGGWWRLQNSDNKSLAHFNVGIQDRFYGSPAILEVTSGETFDETYLYAYDMTKGAAHWTWKSQPLQKTRNRRIDFRELAIVVQGAGTMTFEIIGLDATNTQIVEFTFASNDKPIALVKPISVSSHDVVVSIDSVSDSPDVQAPVLYRMSLGHRPAQGVTATGSQGGKVAPV